MTDKELFDEVDKAVRRMRRRMRRLWASAMGVPLLSGVATAMFGNVIGYGFEHDVTQLIVIGFVGAGATIVAWWLHLWR